MDDHHLTSNPTTRGNTLNSNVIDAAPATAELATPEVDGSHIELDSRNAATETSADTAENGDDRGGNREAAKYRRQLRDAEAQRDDLSDRLATLQRREAERLAAEHLADGADMWRGGLDLAALLDGDGNLDPNKVADAAHATRKAHPHWAAPRPHKRNPAGRGGGLKSGATGSDEYRPTTWQKVLNTRLGDD
jgi:hypothetical protein